MNFSKPQAAYLFLLHQLRIGAVIHNILAKYRRGQWAVNLFGIDISEFSIENEVVAFCSKTDSGLFTQQDKGEDISVFLAACKEKLVRVNAVSHGVADEGNPVKHDGRFIGVAEEELSYDVQEDGNRRGRSQCEEDEFPGTGVCGVFTQSGERLLKKTHVDGNNSPNSGGTTMSG